MANLVSFTPISFFICTLSVIICYAFAANERKVYIAYMGTLPKSIEYSPLENHQSILQQVVENQSPADSLIHSYKRSFNGFAAKLTEKEREKLASKEGIISIFPSRNYKLHTTRSWDFLGLTGNAKRVPKVESDVIVGVIDTGIWPESDSFKDEGFGPAPKKWKGDCNGGQNFTCNNKLIGARFYGSTDARDDQGHGTHTSSTSAGNQVNNVSFYGIAEGNARGAVPSARIASYKVCNLQGCAGADIMAAFDDAISDGVDILSVSLGGKSAFDYLEDPIAIGAFHAMENGIFTSQEAGNSGPLTETVSSVAPWIISVAASTIDRKIINKVILGDNTTLVGNAINGFETTKKVLLVEEILSNQHCNTCHKSISRSCNNRDDMDTSSLKGKIILYVTYDTGEIALSENASGMIVQSDSNRDFAYSYPLPTSNLDTNNAKTVDSYIKNTRKPVASISKSESITDAIAPVVASFSSRGPNPITPQILKPDITAPGADIIAAWSPDSAPSNAVNDRRSVKYNIISGTSMACPHITGAAAYVKSFHPDWSPSAIKSALMTTASSLNATTNPDAELGYGVGHIDLIKAANPGLVYDADKDDYVKFLCNFYPSDKIRSITGDNNTTCPKVAVLPQDLNYPSLTTKSIKSNFRRTVTNVGTANSTYKATIVAPPNLKIKVVPQALSFQYLNQKKSFVVSASVTTKIEGFLTSASLIWSDGIHSVRSPIVFLNEEGTSSDSRI